MQLTYANCDHFPFTQLPRRILCCTHRGAITFAKAKWTQLLHSCKGGELASLMPLVLSVRTFYSVVGLDSVNITAGK